MQSAFHRFLAALLLACLPGLAGAEGTGLFSADDGAIPLRQAPELLLREDPFPQGGWRGESAGGAGELHGGELAPGGASASAALHSRVAEVDLGQLASARLGVERNRLARLNLNLFAGAAFEAVFERSAPTASGYTLTGRLADDPLSVVALAVNGEWVAGTVWGSQGRYAIRPLGGGVAAVRQLGPSAQVRCGVEENLAEGTKAPPVLRHPLGAAAIGTAPAAEAFPEDDGDLIDVLVVYRPFERRLVGGHRAMRALIDGDVAMTNELYRASGVIQRINLVAAVELEFGPQYRELDSQSYLDALRGVGVIGEPNEVQVLRDAYAADIVFGHWGHRFATGIFRLPRDVLQVGGTAFLMAELDPGFESAAFSAGASVSFAHELGHNMGLRHERVSDKYNTPFPYSHGYVVPDNSPLLPPGRKGVGIQTIMAGWVDEFRGIPRFSNPNLRYPDSSGPALGVPGDAPSNSADGPADAVRSLNGTRRVVANFRRSASRCRYQLSPPPSPLPASKGEFRIGVEADEGCAWSAFSNDRFVTVAEGSGGVGDGEVVFSVSANAGWERELAVFVAGEAYLAEQATARTRRETPACDRVAPIRDALVEAAGRPCGEIGTADLAAIRTLEPQHFSLELKPEERRLAPSDFDGLTGLVSLDLGGMNLTALAPGTFDGLIRLTSLNLEHNEITALAAGTFDGLPNLLELKLRYIGHLTTLAPGAFRGLSNVLELPISYALLTTLEPGAFRGLFELQKLHLAFDFDSSAVLLPGLFDDVPNLRHLLVEGSGNRSATLEPGVFRGLSELRRLWVNGNKSLTALQPGLFDGLSKLGEISLQYNHRLTGLESGTFDGLSELIWLFLSNNSQLKTLEPGAFQGLEKMEVLLLDKNQLQALPPRLFQGLPNLRKLYLTDNPGAPFTLVPELIRRPGAGSAPGGTAQITAEIAQGAPFDMRIPLSAIGGSLSAEEVLIPAGAVRGAAVSVIPQGSGPVTVLAAVPGLPPPCKDQAYLLFFATCVSGLKTTSGTPFILHGLPDQTLAVDSAVRFDLPTAFPDFGEGTAYAVESSNPAAVAVLIREGLLIVSAAGGGETTLTVTATSPDGRQETRRFAVKAPAAPEAVGQVPDLSLVVGEFTRIALPGKFRDPDGGPLAYAAESDNAAVAASVDGDAVQVAAKEPGIATVTLTATDPDGLSATLSFKVKVEQPIRSRWGGWRSALLNPPPSEDDDES